MSNIDPKGASFKEFSIFSSDLHAFLSCNGISHMEGGDDDRQDGNSISTWRAFDGRIL